MSFTLLPAVDVADGQAVRLVQGEAGTETAYGEPLEAALAWQTRRRRVDPPRRPRRRLRPRLQRRAARRGRREARRRGRALRRHPRRRVALERALVDRLRPGQPRHRRAGGPAVVRPRDRRARRPGRGRARRADHRHGGRPHRLAARGWTTDGGDLWETLARLDRDGCARYVVTDVSKDGTLRGPNIDLLRDVAERDAGAGDRLRRCLRGGRPRRAGRAARLGRGRGRDRRQGALRGRFTLPEALAAVRPSTPRTGAG